MEASDVYRSSFVEVEVKSSELGQEEHDRVWQLLRELSERQALQDQEAFRVRAWYVEQQQQQRRRFGDEKI